MRCARCFIEYDNGELIAPEGMDIEQAVAVGLAFCVMCIVPQGSPAYLIRERERERDV
jgi:hypothetical protein